MKNAADVLVLAKAWVAAGEFTAASIILEALWQNSDIPKSAMVFQAHIELIEKKNPIYALDVLTQFIAAEGEYFELWKNSSTEMQSYFLEWHGELALQLKDEALARDSLKRAAALGRDTLFLWATLCVLSHRMTEFQESSEYYLRALRRYMEPSLFQKNEHCLVASTREQNRDENFFLGIALYLLPKVSRREGQKILSALQTSFVGRSWLDELRDFVAQESKFTPIEKSGGHYASPDSKDR